MAPEVIERKSYDDKGDCSPLPTPPNYRRRCADRICSSLNVSADVWSFGITALELSLGRAPNSYYAPAKILALLVEAPAPTLDRSGGRHKYGKEMANMIESCLLKDPQSRCVFFPANNLVLSLLTFSWNQTERRKALGSSILQAGQEEILPCPSHPVGLTSPRVATTAPSGCFFTHTTLYGLLGF